jgi:predicted ATP-grasp superfamily ATP-dependent carboligase
MHALVIGNNATLLMNVVWALGAAGHEADVMCDWSTPRARFSRYCRSYVHVPHHKLDLTSRSTVRWVEQYCQTHDIAVVIPADLTTTLAAASLSNTSIPFFPLSSPETIGTLHDKWSFYMLLTSLGVPAPNTQLLEPSSSLATLSLTYPVIVKPSTGEGGEGIVRCDSEQELSALRARLGSDTRTRIVQTWLPGRDVDISVLAEHGRVVAFSIQEDTAVDTKTFTLDERMLAAASEIVRASNFHGLAHFDMRVDSRDDALYVIECNPRVWGSLMYSVWGGVNFIELGYQLSLGVRLPLSRPPMGPVWHQGVAPRRLLKALVSGRSAPPNLTGATLASWRQAHSDPLPQLCGELAERWETQWRTLLDSPWASRLQRQLRQ